MSDEEVIDLHAMKVTELKQELKARGLTVSGTKADLITRLENYMKEHEGVEVVEEDVDDPLDESVEEPQSAAEEKSSGGEKESAEKVAPEPVPEKAASPPPPIGISTTEEDDEPAAAGAVNPLKSMSETDRKAARAGRFATGAVSGTTTDELKKKAERANRFGTTAASSTANSSAQSQADKLAARRARFGMTSPDSIRTEPDTQNKRLKARADRFGSGAASCASTISLSAPDADRAKARLARFGGN